MAEFTRKHVSFSELTQFIRDCQFRWKLENLDGFRRKIFSIHMDFGTAMHGAIERHKTRKNPVDIERARKIFRKYFCLLFQKNSKNYSARDLDFDEKKFSNPKEYFLLAGDNILRRLHECEELASAEVVYNEYQLYGKIDRTDELDIFFKGFIDIVIKTTDKRGNTILYICDFKTCSFGWDREKRQDQMLQAQIFLYKHFFCKKFNLDPKNVRTAFVLLKKRPPPVSKGSKETITPIEFFPVSAGPVSVQRSVDMLNKAITEMFDRTKNETWKLNREKCVNDFGDLCPHYNTERCPGKNPIVEKKLLELKEKRDKKDKKQKQGKPAASPDIHKTTEELRARLFGKK